MTAAENRKEICLSVTSWKASRAKSRIMRGNSRRFGRRVFYRVISIFYGGEGGIRTPGTLASTPHFECGAIDHSATSPSL